MHLSGCPDRERLRHTERQTCHFGQLIAEIDRCFSLDLCLPFLYQVDSHFALLESLIRIAYMRGEKYIWGVCVCVGLIMHVYTLAFVYILLLYHYIPTSLDATTSCSSPQSLVTICPIRLVSYCRWLRDHPIRNQRSI